MKQIESAEETYLLDAPIEVLHRESLEWIEEIKFMKDEAAFFYGLIIRRLKTPYDPLNFEELKGIENQLLFITAGAFAALHDSIDRHERSLSKMMEAMKQNEQNYRSQHNTLAKKIHNFEKEFKELKRKIFAVVEREVKKKKLVKK